MTHSFCTKQTVALRPRCSPLLHTHTKTRGETQTLNLQNGCKCKPASILLLGPKTCPRQLVASKLAARSCYELWLPTLAVACRRSSLVSSPTDAGPWLHWEVGEVAHPSTAQTPAPQRDDLQPILFCPMLLTVLSSDGKGGNTRAPVVAKIQVQGMQKAPLQKLHNSLQSYFAKLIFFCKTIP